MGRVLLTDSAQIYVGPVRKTFKLYKSGSAEKHAVSDDTTLKQALIQALNAPSNKKSDQGNGIFRYKINSGKGYVVYRLATDGPDSATIFHYHWNYSMDLPLTVEQYA